MYIAELSYVDLIIVVASCCSLYIYRRKPTSVLFNSALSFDLHEVAVISAYYSLYTVKIQHYFRIE